VPARPFVVHVAQLRRTVGSRWHEERRGAVEGLACSGSAVPDGAEVVADVDLDAVLGGVAVEGTVRAPWTGACRRCLSPAAGELRVAVRELYTEGGDGEETYPLAGDVVDLEPLVHDAVLLELPQAPLCRADCRGLCPVCGANRNDEDCACEAPTDPRWAALDVLRPGAQADAGAPGGEPPAPGRPRARPASGPGPASASGTRR